MNLPGKIHVTERSEDSRLEMTETLFTRKASYLAKADDITGMCANETQGAVVDVYASRLSENRVGVRCGGYGGHGL